MRFYLFKGDRPSEGAANLVETLGATTLRSQGSAFTGRDQRALINWGSYGQEAQRIWDIAQADKRFNNPQAIRIATNKLTALQRLQEHSVPIVPYWGANDMESVRRFVTQGGRVYARTQLSGHSGEGIKLIINQDDPQLGIVRNNFRESDFYLTNRNPDNNLDSFRRQFQGCQLFTQGITGHRKEWRVHVFQGRCILTQLKMRRSGFRDDGRYTSLVRNTQTGWVYSVNFDQTDHNQIGRVRGAAVQAIAALGLDFGAVDIIQKDSDNSVYVLEVNTAPGLGEGGSAIAAYAQAFQGWAQAQQERA